MSEVNTLLQHIRIPSDFARYEKITEDPVISRLEEWKRNAHHILLELRTTIASSELSLQEQANVISVTAAFDGDGPWITPASQNASRGISP